MNPDIHHVQVHADDPGRDWYWPRGVIERPFFVRLKRWDVWRRSMNLDVDFVCDNRRRQ